MPQGYVRQSTLFFGGALWQYYTVSFCRMSRFSMDMFGYILFSFRDSCPDFIPFRQNTPCVGSRRGTAQGAALLTKWGETAIIKAERALLLAVGSSYQLIIIFMLTVWHHPGGQHAFMESASAKNTTHSRNFKKNLSIPASPPSNVDFARG